VEDAMKKHIIIVVTLFALLASTASPALADGGLIIPDSALWNALEEGQQVAVVALSANGAIRTDLFISLVDHTGVSHEVTFFVPLGKNANGFGVQEKESSAFESTRTDPLDDQLQQAARERQSSSVGRRVSLLPGSWIIGGGWAWPVFVVLMLSGCSVAPPPPLAVLYTASSQVAIYGINENTDVAALIATTGLDQSVQETLRALQGQQIAVVKMRTQPPATGDASSLGQRVAKSQAGLHLQWNSRAVEQTGGGWEHRYPLGTGRAWARPIPLTRVYITAPAGVDFRLEYPTYGTDRSGYETPPGSVLWSTPYGSAWNLLNHRDETGYAVDRLVTQQVHIERIAYTQANPTTDIRIIRDATATGRVRTDLIRLRLRQLGDGWGWLIDLYLALMIWMVCWRYVMPSHLGRRYRWLGWALWRDALIYPLAYGVFAILVIGLAQLNSILLSIVPEYYRIEGFYGIFVGLLALAGILLGLPLSYVGFARLHKAAGSEAKAGYWKVVALANVAYWIAGMIVASMLD
jgi:hypothetical protein